MVQLLFLGKSRSHLPGPTRKGGVVLVVGDLHFYLRRCRWLSIRVMVMVAPEVENVAVSNFHTSRGVATYNNREILPHFSLLVGSSSSSYPLSASFVVVFVVTIMHVLYVEWVLSLSLLTLLVPGWVLFLAAAVRDDVAAVAPEVMTLFLLTFVRSAPTVFLVVCLSAFQMMPILAGQTSRQKHNPADINNGTVVVVVEDIVSLFSAILFELCSVHMSKVYSRSSCISGTLFFILLLCTVDLQQ
jgi:hypothetical protein